MVQRGAPLFVGSGSPESLGVVLQGLPLHEQQEAGGAFDTALDPKRNEPRAGGNEGLRLLHGRDELELAAANDLEQRVLGDHERPSSRSRSAGSVAASMAVQARATAPSRTAASAEGVTHAAANSRWWLTAPLVSMPIKGWIVGTASDTFAMSVEIVGNGVPASSSSNLRPRPSAFAR